MRLFKSFILCSLFILIGTAAFASSEFNLCNDVAGGSNTAATAPYIVRSGSPICFDFTTTESSALVVVQAKSVLICLDPSAATEGTANATVHIRQCMQSTKPGSNPNFTCTRITETPLDGTQGNASQNACIRAGTGFYYVQNSTSAAGDNARVKLQSEE